MKYFVSLLFLACGLAGSTQQANTLPVGSWKVAFSNGVNEVCYVSAGGQTKVTEPLRQSRGMAEVTGNSILITFADDRVERWTPVGKQYVVEHFYPGSQMETVKPVLGIAKLTH